VKKTILLIFIISNLLYLQADIISGINIKNSIQIQKEKLYLNGAGMRSILFFDLYIGALYLKSNLDNARDIILLKKPMDIRMYITSSLISSGKLKSGFKAAFAKRLQFQKSTFWYMAWQISRPRKFKRKNVRQVIKIAYRQSTIFTCCIYDRCCHNILTLFVIIYYT